MWLLPAWLDPGAGSDVDEYPFVLPGQINCVVWPLPAWLAPIGSDFIFVLPGWVDCVMGPLATLPVGSDLAFFTFVLPGRWPESASLLKPLLQLAVRAPAPGLHANFWEKRG